MHVVSDRPLDEVEANHLRSARESSRPTILPVVGAYVVAFLLVFVATSALVFGVALRRVGMQPAALPTEAMKFALSGWGISACALLSATVLAATALVFARLDTPHLSARLRLGVTRATRAGLLATIGAMIGLSFATAATCDLLGLHGQGSMAAIGLALRMPTPLRFVVALATIAIAPGVAEEVFFRGLVQTRLVSRWGRWPAIVATAAGFGLLHLDLVQASVAFIAGVYLGWVVERFDGIRPAVVAHTLNNAAFVVLASFGSSDRTTRNEAVTVALIGGLVAIIAIALLRSPLAVERSHPLARQ